MKKLTGTLFFALTLTQAFAQSVDIAETVRTSVNGTYKSYLFELPDVEEKQAEEDWKKWMERYNAKTKFDKKNEMWYAENVLIPQFHKDPVNIFANIVGEEKPVKRTSVIVWFAIGENQIFAASDSLNEKGGGSYYAREMLTNYAMNAYLSQAQATLKAEENLLDEYNKELKNLQKDRDDFAKTIEKAKNNITENEKNIATNEIDQASLSAEIEDQRIAVDKARSNVQNSESRKEAESALKTEEKRLASLEKDLKKLQKDLEDYHEKIKDAKNTIALHEMKIEINQRDQDNKLEIIEAHKKTIELAKENVKKYSK